MEAGMIGLGRMGMNMVRRLLRGGHQIAAYNRTPARTEEIVREGARGAFTLDELASGLQPPRVVWLMLPAGEAVDEHIERLAPLLAEGDVVVDGGNSFYKDSVRRARRLEAEGLHFLDAGVSGGVWGLAEGYCLMIGGPEPAFRVVEPLLKTLAPPEGYIHSGPAGSGHFVKMVHNGIEYGMMQAYGEGFALLEASDYGRNLDLSRLSRVWNRGSVIRSWLLELAEDAFAGDPRLETIEPYVEDSGEGRWTIQTAVELGVPAPAISISLMERFRSRQNRAFQDRVLAALRREFGGHAVVRAGTDEKT
ncbi:MAG: decarboxylating 6-phosphogluconate dehydrogenase [Proteobacteria bacterium]|nr:decarboxylating 6-phosphogluconate dehydrogenase [Pseudomonadota bacterium]